MATTTDLLPRLTDATAGSAREGTDLDAVDGLRPSWVASPADTDGVAAVLRLAQEQGLAVVPRGGGTKLGWGAPPERLDVLLDLTRLDTLVDHAAGDLVAVVGAGRRLDDLQADLASAGQWFAVDPARRGTLGGLVATADTGPTRLVHGPVRDLVIGATLVRADGVIAHAGGTVVKNVAGYDLSKLLTGSFGTLGVLTQVAVRLHPVPEASRWVVVPVSSAQHAFDLVQSVVHSQLVATACELDRPAGGDAHLAVRVDGIAAGVPARADSVADLLGAGAQQADGPPSWWGCDPGEPDDVRLKVTHEIASVARLLTIVDDVSSASGVALDLRGSVAVGAVGVALRGRPGPAAVAAVLEGLRRRAREVGGSVVVRDAPATLRRDLDVWGPVAGLDLMRRVKDQLDPDRVLAPGRFVGGI